MQLPEVPESQETDDTSLDVDVVVIRLISDQSKTDLEAGFTVTEPVMVDEELLVPDKLKEELAESYVGQPFSLKLLEEVTRSILNAYRKSDYPLVDAYLPEQNISGGKLQIVVKEAVFGELSVEGAEHSDPTFLMDQIRVSPGERINTRILESDIDWINSNPSRRVDLIYERGEVEGTSDIVLKTDDLSPNSAYVSFGNTGIDATGLNEWATGINMANVGGTEHSLGYNFSGDEDLGNLNSHVLIYEVPLPWRHRLEFLGAYVTSESQTGPVGGLVDVEGENIQATANYKILMPKLLRKYRQNLAVSLDFKSSNSDILFGGDTLFATTGVVFQYRLGYDVTLSDKQGYTKLDLGWVFSPGDSVWGNSDADFNALRFGSSSDYWYLTGSVERIQRLPKDWNAKLLVSGQLTDHRLNSTEQILAGGYRTVRGFDENLIRGDSGVKMTAEVISPFFPVFGEKCDWWEDSANFFVFYDNAFLYTNEITGEPLLSQAIQSVGLGVNYSFFSKYRARASYGWNIYDDSLLFGVPDGKLHFGFTASF